MQINFLLYSFAIETIVSLFFKSLIFGHFVGNSLATSVRTVPIVNILSKTIFLISERSQILSLVRNGDFIISSICASIFVLETV